jgi:hypothetical protein
MAKAAALPRSSDAGRCVARYLDCQTPELFKDPVYSAADWERHVSVS